MKSFEYRVSTKDLIEYKKKMLARRIVVKHIRLGNLSRSELCETCGLNTKTEAHHTDYGRPLAVMWLCDKCHGEAHKRDSIYNPKNIYQTPVNLQWKEKEKVTVSFTLPIENFLVLKRLCEEKNQPLSKILRDSIVESFPVESSQLKFNFEGDNGIREHIQERISLLEYA